LKLIASEIDGEFWRYQKILKSIFIQLKKLKIIFSGCLKSKLDSTIEIKYTI